jgi:hypothetical protein
MAPCTTGHPDARAGPLANVPLSGDVSGLPSVPGTSKVN